MSSCSSIATLMAMKQKPLPNDREHVDATHYQSIVQALHYLTFTRPYITYVVNQVCQYFACPTSANLKKVNVSCNTCKVLIMVFSFMVKVLQIYMAFVILIEPDVLLHVIVP